MSKEYGLQLYLIIFISYYLYLHCSLKPSFGLWPIKVWRHHQFAFMVGHGYKAFLRALLKPLLHAFNLQVHDKVFIKHF